jgi:hypothetical protein
MKLYLNYKNDSLGAYTFRVEPDFYIDYPGYRDYIEREFWLVGYIKKSESEEYVEQFSIFLGSYNRFTHLKELHRLNFTYDFKTEFFTEDIFAYLILENEDIINAAIKREIPLFAGYIKERK